MARPLGVLLLGFLAASTSVSCARGTAYFERGDAARFLMLGVLEGLMRDGADPEVVASLLNTPKPGLFVYKCPVCNPVKEAFEMYLAGVDGIFWFNPIGDEGWPENLDSALRSENRDARLHGMQGLVTRYVRWAFEKARFTHAERTQMEELIREARRYGTGMVKSSFGIDADSCANCDGAVYYWNGIRD